jgi:hypothetical protein
MTRGQHGSLHLCCEGLAPFAPCRSPGAPEMKSRTKPALRVVPAAQVQLSLAVDGVLRDVQHAFYGLCVNAGKQVLAAMMEADRVALCGAKNVPVAW